MATVGQQLKTPEAGWRRYDDTDSRILYVSNNWVRSNTGNNGYNGTGSNTFYSGELCIFKFYGTKLRIISSIDTNRSFDGSADIFINNVNFGTILQRYGSTSLHSVLVYETIDLPIGIHTVSISTKNCTPNTLAFSIDAVDIDSNGYLVLFEPGNLAARVGNSQVTLNWDAIAGATGYNVKRSTIAGGPYETIANVVGTSYVDTNVVNGITYYYVVSTVAADDESDNSNEVSAMPTAPPVEEGEALLRVTMIDSSEREYELTTGQIDGFINWFNNHTSGDPASYMLNKSTGLRTSKEYLAFDKIISFEVTEIK